MTKDSNLLQDWLSGKSGKKDSSKKHPIDNLYSGTDHPYKRFFMKGPSLELIQECIFHMMMTKEPLPFELIQVILYDIELLMSNREGEYFKREKKTPTIHPNMYYLQDLVVAYVETSKNHNLDPNPMRTIKDKLGISKSTYYEWKKTHGGHQGNFLMTSGNNTDITEDDFEMNLAFLKETTSEEDWDEREKFIRLDFAKEMIRRQKMNNYPEPKEQMERLLNYLISEFRNYKKINK